LKVNAMPTDLTIVLVNRPGADADALQALGQAGINVEGVTGSGCGGEGILHVLVADGAAAHRALESAGQVVREERDVLVWPVDDRPGASGAVMRRIAEARVNVDFIYLTTSGKLVIGASDLDKARIAVTEPI
jgi:hypothetical protein